MQISKTTGTVLCLAFALFFIVPCALADSLTVGTITFTATQGSIPTAGSFVFDNTTNVYTSFSITWDGAVFDYVASGMLNPFHNTLANSGTWSGNAPGSGVIIDNMLPNLFQITTVLVGPLQIPPVAQTYVNQTTVADGTFAVQETTISTREPGSVIFLLLGIAILLVITKRTA
jgi:hypothetical protein